MRPGAASGAASVVWWVWHGERAGSCAHVTPCSDPSESTDPCEQAACDREHLPAMETAARRPAVDLLHAKAHAPVPMLRTGASLCMRDQSMSGGLQASAACTLPCRVSQCRSSSCPCPLHERDRPLPTTRFERPAFSNVRRRDMLLQYRQASQHRQVSTAKHTTSLGFTRCARASGAEDVH